MGAGDRPEDCDQDDQHGAGRQGVAEQRQGRVMRQGLGHDAGTDDCRHQQAGAEKLGGEPARKIEYCHVMLPGTKRDDYCRVLVPG